MITTLRRWYRTLADNAQDPPSIADYLSRQVERSWKKESRNLHWFGIRDGMSVLDMGCGPGHFTERLAGHLPDARITALDSEPRWLDLARRRLAGRALVVEGRAEATGLPSSSFDFVLARLLFQHLRDPLRVAQEAHRLLKPGGKLVITDVDDELFGIVEPRVPGIKRLLARYAESQRNCGGDRFIGRRLAQVLRNAGFVDLEIEAVATHSDQAGIDATLPIFEPMSLRSLVESGDLSRLEYPLFRLLHKRYLRHDGRFALVLNFMVCGVKPERTLDQPTV
ncbi:MAG TPA: methyltransferase domain-containing protein [Burkholderiaceae bacterium]|nr:methyltransferase domain-containing protein [Burkholderiaceae bacterium]